jgi:hypothetical protein
LGFTSWVFNPHPTKKERSTAIPPSWISLRAAREVVDPHPTPKIPNGSTAHPCALRALTIIPDGYTVFLMLYFGNFEGELVQTVIAVSIEGLVYWLLSVKRQH